MRTFKWIDAGLSTVLIIYFMADYTIAQSTERLIFSYFIIGAWQSISMIIHAWNKWYTRKYSVRHIYHWIAFVSVVTMPIGSIWILFFTAPFMAIFYTTLCFHECAAKIKRPLSLIKN